MAIWTLHGDGRTVRPEAVVRPEERLAWPYTVGIGLQHVVAMFGATFLVPVLTGFPPSTTIFFSGIGTLVFLAVTRNRIPSYLGSSFAFIAPVLAAQADGGIPAALGGIVAAGVLLALVGLLVQAVGSGPVEELLPPVVTGAIVLLIGLNLAPVAKQGFATDPLVALVTLLVVVGVTVASRGLLGRLSVVVGVVVGYVLAALRGGVSFDAVRTAPWVGLPDLTAPAFSLSAVVLVLPVVLVLVAEKHRARQGSRVDDRARSGRHARPGVRRRRSGHGRGRARRRFGHDDVRGEHRRHGRHAGLLHRAVLRGGGVRRAARPVAQGGRGHRGHPQGVLGGVTTVLYGLIAVLGARIWIEARTDFRDPVNLVTAALAVILGAADYSFEVGDLQFAGISIGSVAAVVTYRVMRALQRTRSTGARV